MKDNNFRRKFQCNGILVQNAKKNGKKKLTDSLKLDKLRVKCCKMNTEPKGMKSSRELSR